MPNNRLREISLYAATWLQGNRKIVAATDRPNDSRFFRLWDRIADLAFHREELEKSSDDQDIDTQLRNRTGGILAQMLLDFLSEQTICSGSDLRQATKVRLNKIMTADGQEDLNARACLAYNVTLLESIDKTWVEKNLQPRFSWTSGEAMVMWRARSQQGHLGSARLFNALKSDMLITFEHTGLSEIETNGLIYNLLDIGLAHQCNNMQEYQLTHAEIKRVLTLGPPTVRRKASWMLWKTMHDQDGNPYDRPGRWRNVVGPMFRAIWPLDVALRDIDTTKNIVRMARDCEEAISEGIEAVLDFVVPYQIYQISEALRLDQPFNHMTPTHTVAYVRLTSALIAPAKFQVPNDLTTFLQECCGAKPDIEQDTAYKRLYGFRRQKNA